MSELIIETPAIPLPLLEALKGLWKAGFRKEEQAFESGAFRLLAHNCSALYPGISESRLAKSPTSEPGPRTLLDALRNFFRWTGAPCYSQPVPLSAEDAAARLHAAFLMQKVRRKYVVPLDRLGLTDTTRNLPKELTRLAFGPCEVTILGGEEFAAHVRADALGRFGERHRLDPKQFADFYYLVTTAEEKAGPIWERGDNFDRLQNLAVDSPVLEPRLYEPIYPEPVGSAVLTMLLRFRRDPREAHREPFAVPWVYSVTDDPFSHPEHTSDPFAHAEAPDPSSLRRTTIGPPEKECRVPDRGEKLKFRKEEIEKALQETWNKLQTALEARQLHPLAKHFFLKGFRDKGIDQINSNLSCLEATLMLKEWPGREKMYKRYKQLVRDADCFNWLPDAYRVRDDYLHSLGQPDDKFPWDDLEGTRWAVTKAVDAYLKLAAGHSGKDRETLLRSLDPPPEKEGSEKC